jgi:hypothetical protein
MVKQTQPNETMPVPLKQRGTNQRIENERRRLHHDPCPNNRLLNGDDIARVHRTDQGLKPCPALWIGSCAHGRAIAQRAFLTSPSCNQPLTAVTVEVLVDKA